MFEMYVKYSWTVKSLVDIAKVTVMHQVEEVSDYSPCTQERVTLARQNCTVLLQ